MPSTYEGWTIVPMPSTPSAPANIEFTARDAVSMSVSPFIGTQQTYYWGDLPMECSVSMSAMPHAVAQPWVTWLRALQGVMNVFQFGAAFTAAYSGDLGTRYWRLKSNQRKWSVSEARMYGIHFECVEVRGAS